MLTETLNDAIVQRTPIIKYKMDLTLSGEMSVKDDGSFYSLVSTQVSLLTVMYKLKEGDRVQCEGKVTHRRLS